MDPDCGIGGAGGRFGPVNTLGVTLPSVKALWPAQLTELLLDGRSIYIYMYIYDDGDDGGGGENVVTRKVIFVFFAA